ncbi:uncharacterized protein LOC132800766 [Ziziphus jujuba]|uniref:Uncharacterized protein LOC132800766 n=1 Tax=Ziziphus jujuba TaxID=326968 RepID=A0ABM4A2S0_ZIZJJ|nr:uncharacterized protein LOC132800766 [Ziziphus jujuba]
MAISVEVSQRRSLPWSTELPSSGIFLNLSVNQTLRRELRTTPGGLVVQVSSYPLAPQLHTSLFLPNHLLRQRPIFRNHINNFLSQVSGFRLPHFSTDRLASNVLAAALLETGLFSLDAQVDLVVRSSELVVDPDLVSNGNMPHGDDHRNFQFIDDQLIIDQAPSRLPSSSDSTGSRTQTQTVDRLSMTTHEKVVAENGDNGELGGCCICLDNFSAGTELIRFGCKHLYHQNCIVKWLENQNSCPLCRRPL